MQRSIDHDDLARLTDPAAPPPARRAHRWGLALLLTGVLVACGAPTSPPGNGGNGEPEELALASVSASSGTQGDTLSVHGENIAGTANVTLGGQAVAATVYDAQDAVVAGESKDGVRAEFTVPVVAIAQNAALSVTVSQTTAADGSETRTLQNVFTYLVDGRLEELGDVVYSFADDTVGDTPGTVAQPWLETGVTVETSTWARDGRVLRVAPYTGPFDGNGYHATVFTAAGSANSVEVVMRVRDTEAADQSHWMTGIGSRLNGTTHSERGVLAQMIGDDTESHLVVARLNRDDDDSGPLEATNWEAFPLEPRGTYMRVRTSVDLDGFQLVSVRTWDGTVFDEPEDWNVTGFEIGTPLAGGGVGLTRFFGEHATELDWIAITVID